ncbi:SAM-dependent methyltransferase [Photobacterium sp. NCIMB 13483]|uniref:class I SAM-dependent DNA methyltransferase n=1 Tax=Photobacterium sp. NCIMB 13483 TaxID=2022103 RepID=UPI000D15D06F|nr:class I SAM-dependent methyltransferase [Photobacterium sp. NCIMB 13483]PST94254.1 SAM-dependent methyltransferase [Photobacterium sp. NCIMB 13483]
MSELYSKHAAKYDSMIQTNIYNAMYDFPSMTALIGDVTGLDIVDLGCGSGVYAQYFIDNNAAQVTCIDASPEMIDIVQTKLGARVISQGLAVIEAGSADRVISALMIHYLADLNALCADVSRILKQGGEFVFSTHHPFADFNDSASDNYFQRELITDMWNTVGEPVKVQFYRRALSEITTALTDNGLMISALTEGQVLEQAKTICEKTYHFLSTKPNFLFIKAVKV